MSRDSPFSLRHFLPAGTVELAIGTHTHSFFSNHTDPALPEDGWHEFCDAEFMQKMVEPSCYELCRALWYLARHKFIAATYTILNDLSLVLVRVYLIPYDLANVQGKLNYRARKKDILALARTYMSSLLPQIAQDHQRWEGAPPLADTLPRMFIESSAVDRRTLPEIYSDLLSPKPSKTESKSVVNRLLDYADDLGGLGLRSTLHRYQRRSVAAMLQMEHSGASDTPNPLYIPLTGLDGKVFYYQPGTTEILREQYMVSSTQSGVLCEELGTGKTVIVLALVRATINELPQPEESLIEDRPILTPLAFRHFPSCEFAASRERHLRGKKTRKQLKSDPVSTVPSLREILLHLLRSKPDISIPDTRDLLEVRKDTSDLLEQLTSFSDWRRASTPFYLHYKGEPSDYRSSSRGFSDPGPKVMYLSTATLIVVPQNLISQWDREIKKHCEEIPRVLIVRSGVPLPSAKNLASDYDIILFSYSRFNDEDKKANVNKLHPWKFCKCPEFPGSRVPQCSCNISEVSPLLQVRWRRLVVDEGHVSSSVSTRFTPFTKLLSVQSKWIVTGTPTTNLLGLSFGSSSGDILEQIQDQDVLNESAIETPIEDENSECTSRAVSEDTDTLSSPNLQVARVWTEHDSMDIHKLLNMIVHFVGVKFLGDSVIRTHIKEALLDNRGPRPGAITMLERLMNMVMIRHRIKDVEEEVVLPKLTQEAVFLDLGLYMRLSYNALQAGIAINAIDSQRTDQDYMFHRSNVDSLQLTVKNMSQMMFWSVDEDLYNVVALAQNIPKILENAEKKKLPPEDVALAQECLPHVLRALQDGLWRQLQTHVEIPYHVYNLPSSICKSWSKLCVVNSSTDTTADRTLGELMHPDRLSRLRDTVVHRPLIDQASLVQEGERVAKEEQEPKSTRQKEKSRGSKRHENQSTSDLKSLNASKNAAASSTIKEMQQELRVSLARLEFLEQSDSPAITSRHPPRTIKLQPSVLLSSSPIADVHIGASASTKLNYILEEVQKYSSNEKFLIFSDSELTLAHVGDGLELLQVKYLRFSTQVSPQHREQLVLTFETSDTYRVFLMELKHGARGLNLVSASRVIFCEPVWQADIESQAIKRAHRIGQVRPVTVKTLAIRGTSEEKMIERREILKQTGDKIPKLLEETGMRHFIANPRFIGPDLHRENSVPQVNFPLLRLSPRVGSDQIPISVSESAAIRTSAPVTPPVTPSRKRVRVEEPVDHPSGSVSPELNPAKKRVVRFGV